MSHLLLKKENHEIEKPQQQRCRTHPHQDHSETIQINLTQLACQAIVIMLKNVKMSTDLRGRLAGLTV
jgi:hypothetical protein